MQPGVIYAIFSKEELRDFLTGFHRALLGSRRELVYFDFKFGWVPTACPALRVGAALIEGESGARH